MISIFHIILHIFECFIIFVCLAVIGKLTEDYNALRGWIEFSFKIDLNELAKRIEEWKKEEGIT